MLSPHPNNFENFQFAVAVFTHSWPVLCSKEFSFLRMGNKTFLTSNAAQLWPTFWTYFFRSEMLQLLIKKHKLMNWLNKYCRFSRASLTFCWFLLKDCNYIETAIERCEAIPAALPFQFIKNSISNNCSHCT